MAAETMDSTFIAGMMAGAVAAAKIVEKLIEVFLEKFFTKKEEDKVVIVQLDPESSRMIRETHENAKDMTAVMKVLDHDGTPMVYSPRSTAETVQNIAETLRDVSNSQERLAVALEKVQDKVEDFQEENEKARREATNELLDAVERLKR